MIRKPHFPDFIPSLPNKWTQNIGRMPMPRGIGFQPMIQTNQRDGIIPSSSGHRNRAYRSPVKAWCRSDFFNASGAACFRSERRARRWGAHLLLPAESAPVHPMVPPPGQSRPRAGVEIAALPPPPAWPPAHGAGLPRTADSPFGGPFRRASRRPVRCAGPGSNAASPACRGIAAPAHAPVA